MRIILTLIFALQFGNSYCQVNLVPNPGFDTISSCPTNGAQIYKAPPWIDPTNATSDLINLCGTGNYCQAPNNEYGWQMPYTGDGFAGIATYVDSVCCPNTREYIQAPLLSALETGVTYCVSLRFSWADSSKFACDGLGILFTTNPVSCNACLLPYSPQIQNTPGNVLSDGTQWFLLSASFIAQGGEQYITIGNFIDDSNMQIQQVNPTAFYIVAYYFIDDVSVTKVEPISPGASFNICDGDSVQIGSGAMQGVLYSWQPSIGLSDSTLSNPIAAPTSTTTYTLNQTQCDVVQTTTVTVTVRTDCDTPSVFFIPTVLAGNQALEVSGLEENSRLTIYDMRGRKVFNSENYQNNFQANSVAEGQYLIELETSEGDRIKQKLIITR